MAKKKSEPATKSESKASANKPAAKKAAKKAGSGSVPMIDTGLAAQVAAKAVLSGATGAAVGQTPSTKPAESAAFKNFKASLNQPKLTGVNAGLLGGPAAGKKAVNPYLKGDQKGHNQTFGSEGSRTYVPRRTSGG